MKAHTKKVMARWDKLLKDTDSQDIYEKTQEFIVRVELFVKTVAPDIKTMFASREHLIAAIDECDPDNPNDREQLLFLVAMIERLPRIGRHVVDEMIDTAKKNFPALRPGRPGISEDVEQQIVEFIAHRQSQNKREKLSSIQASAAKKFNVGTRSVRRAWDTRDEHRLTDEEVIQVFKSYFDKKTTDNLIKQKAAEQQAHQTAAGAMK